MKKFIKYKIIKSDFLSQTFDNKYIHKLTISGSLFKHISEYDKLFEYIEIEPNSNEKFNYYLNNDNVKQFLHSFTKDYLKNVHKQDVDSSIQLDTSFKRKIDCLEHITADKLINDIKNKYYAINILPENERNDIKSLFKQSYKLINSDDTIKMVAYILDYYIEAETYPHTIYINEYGIIDGLFTKINKRYFDIERVVYKAFNSVFNIKNLDVVPTFSFSKLILGLTDDKYADFYQSIHNVIKLLKVKKAIYKKYKFNDFSEVNLTDGYDSTIYNIITKDLEYSLDTEVKSEQEELNSILIDKIYNLDETTLELFVRDLENKLKNIVRRYDIYFIMKPLQINLINKFNFNTSFYETAFVYNSVMYLLGAEEYGSKLSKSTIFKFNLNRDNKLWNAYFGYKEGRAQTHICVPKKNIIDCLIFIANNFSHKYIDTIEYNKPTYGTNIYNFSTKIINKINKLTVEKLNDILQKLCDYSLIDILDNEKEYVYEYKTLEILHNIAKFVYSNKDKNIEHSAEEKFARALKIAAAMGATVNLTGGTGCSNILDFIIKNSEHKFDFNKKQKEAINNLEKYHINIITGGPGTGKTTTVSKTPKYYLDNGYKVWMLSPTGKAAGKLKKDVLESLGKDELPEMIDIKTIHSKIGTLSRKKSDSYKSYNPKDIIVFIEESSMVGCELFAKLIYEVNRLDIIVSQLIILGDENQLPPVKSPCKSSLLSVMIEIYRLKQYNICYTELTECCRAEDEKLVNIFQDISKGKTDSLKNAIKNRVSCIQVLTTEQFRHESKNINDYDKNMLITPLNKNVNYYNSVCQQNKFGFKKRNVCSEEFKESHFIEDDRVVCCKNYNKEEIYNGYIGNVLEITTTKSRGILRKSIVVKYPDGVTAQLDGEINHDDHLRHGYVLTTHKSQGSEADNVYYIHTSSADRTNIYTAVTRAKKKVIIVCDNLLRLYGDIEEREKKKIKTNIKYILENLD